MKKLNLLLALLICITLLSCFEENVDFASAIQSDNQFPTPEANSQLTKLIILFQLDI